METAFSTLKQQGKNTSEGLIMFLKENKLLDDTTEKIARQCLAGVSDPKNIDYTKFAEVCKSVAKAKGIDMANISKKVADALHTKLGNSTGVSTAAASPKDPLVADSTNVNDHINELKDHPEEDDYNDSEDEDYQSDDYHEPSDEQHESDDQENV